MSHTFKVVTVVGTSPQSHHDAIQNGIKDAGASLRHLAWFEVREMRGRVEQGRIVEYQVKLDIGFRVETS